ncbi:hypothetical protein KZZ07_26470, partial [Mameliella sp. CS4]|uniref:hypothetical protein n=1 Tax=Mameliella sp. CS4 TaxID=2862329 RepID=UPI001C5F86EA
SASASTLEYLKPHGPGQIHRLQDTPPIIRTKLIYFNKLPRSVEAQSTRSPTFPYSLEHKPRLDVLVNSAYGLRAEVALGAQTKKCVETLSQQFLMPGDNQQNPCKTSYGG